MRRPFILLAAVVVGVIVLLLQTVFVVDQTKQVLVKRFGSIERFVNVGREGRPGLYVKLPLIDNAVYYEKRNLGLPVAEQSILAADQENLMVDAFVRWRIVDPLRFYQAAGAQSEGAERLNTFAQSSLRRILGAAVSTDIISGRRAQLMQAIRTDLNREAAANLGVYVIDVRIRRAEYPPQTQTRIFARMRTERQQEAAGIRARGDEQAARVRADADRQVTVILATAREEAARTRGGGDGERARIFARAYGRNPEFAAFYRSLQAYEQAIPAGTPMVVPPDSDFFRYLRNPRGGR